MFLCFTIADREHEYHFKICTRIFVMFRESVGDVQHFDLRCIFTTVKRKNRSEFSHTTQDSLIYMLRIVVFTYRPCKPTLRVKLSCREVSVF